MVGWSEVSEKCTRKMSSIAPYESPTMTTVTGFGLRGYEMRRWPAKSPTFKASKIGLKRRPRACCSGVVGQEALTVMVSQSSVCL